MKTTIEIPDSLLREMRKIAAREGVTLQVLVERGLRRVVADVKHAVPFKLRQASFNGRGLRAPQSAVEQTAQPDLRGSRRVIALVGTRQIRCVH